MTRTFSCRRRPMTEAVDTNRPANPATNRTVIEPTQRFKDLCIIGDNHFDNPLLRFSFALNLARWINRSKGSVDDRLESAQAIRLSRVESDPARLLAVLRTSLCFSNKSPSIFVYPFRRRS